MEKHIGARLKKWEIIEDKNIADVLVIVYGKTKNELLNNLLNAFISIITEIKKIKKLKKQLLLRLRRPKIFPNRFFY